MPRRKRNKEEEAPKKGKRASKQREPEAEEKQEDQNLPVNSPGVDLYMPEGLEVITDPEEYERAMEATKTPTTGMDDPKNVLVKTTKWHGDYFIRLLPMVGAKGEAVRYSNFLRAVGNHWNVIPPEEDQSGGEPVGCPNINWGLECPICHLIDEAIRRRFVTFKEVKGDGMDNILVKKRYIARGLLYDFDVDDGESNTPPDWSSLDLPVIKVFEIASMVRNWIGNKINKSAAFSDKIFHPVKGRVIIVTKLKDRPYYDPELEDEATPIPEEFMNTKLWPNLDAFVPPHTTQDVISIIEENQADLPKWFRRAWQTYDVDYAAVDVESREVD